MVIKKSAPPTRDQFMNDVTANHKMNKDISEEQKEARLLYEVYNNNL